MRMIVKANELQEVVKVQNNFKLTNVESELVLDYLEGHGYGIGIGENNQMYFVDIEDSEEESFEEDFTEILDRVVEWNYELIQDCDRAIEREIASIEQHEEYAQLMDRKFDLQNDEKILDKLREEIGRAPMNQKEKEEIINCINQELKCALMDDAIEEIGIQKIDVIGSRAIGKHRENSDLDILVEYTEDIKEDYVFNMLNGLDIEYDGVVVDFFPKKISNNKVYSIACHTRLESDDYVELFMFKDYNELKKWYENALREDLIAVYDSNNERNTSDVYDLEELIKICNEVELEINGNDDIMVSTKPSSYHIWNYYDNSIEIELILKSVEI